MSDYQWLPAKLNQDDYTTIESFKKAAYGYFLKDFIKSKPTINGKTILANDRIFEHIVTKGPEGKRTLNYERCEHVPWIKPILENVNKEEVKCWTEESPETVSLEVIKIALIFPTYAYLIVLKDDGDGKKLGLSSAYCVEDLKKIKKEYRSYLNKKKTFIKEKSDKKGLKKKKQVDSLFNRAYGLKMQGVPQEEIAEQLDISIEEVASILKRKV